MIRRTLVAMDGSAHGLSAGTFALEWARRFGTELVGLGILDEPSITRPEPVSFGGTAFKRHRDEIRPADAHRRILELLGDFRRRCDAAGMRCTVVEDLGREPRDPFRGRQERADVRGRIAGRSGQAMTQPPSTLRTWPVM